MSTRMITTLTTTALGLAAVAAAAGAASAADLTGASLGTLPLAKAGSLLPGAAESASGAHTAVNNGTSALPTKGLLPSDNHLSGNQVAPVTGLLGGLPAGAGILGG